MLLSALKINIKTSINYPQLKIELMYFYHFDNISLHKIYFWHFWLTDTHPVITHSNKENCYRTKYFSSIVSACDRWVYDLSSFYIRVLRKNRTCVNECWAMSILCIYGCFMFQCWMLFLDLEVKDIEFLKFYKNIASYT